MSAVQWSRLPDVLAVLALSAPLWVLLSPNLWSAVGKLRTRLRCVLADLMWGFGL